MKINFRIAASSLILAASVISSAVYADPQNSTRNEEAANPALVNAVNSMNAALKELQAAPNEFGGNKAKAIADLKTAIDSTKRALNYYPQKNEDQYDGSLTH
ncbi:MAG: hypothetical protein ABSB19_17915 [Methylomonas sp.]|jgi:hypothetical protein